MSEFGLLAITEPFPTTLYVHLNLTLNPDFLRPARKSRSVVLPLPDGPIMPTKSPGSKYTETLSRITCSPCLSCPRSFIYNSIIIIICMQCRVDIKYSASRKFNIIARTPVVPLFSEVVLLGGGGVRQITL